jgi:hypothetical protein
MTWEHIQIVEIKHKKSDAKADEKKPEETK